MLWAAAAAGAVITRPNGCVFPAADDTSAVAVRTLFPAH